MIMLNQVLMCALYVLINIHKLKCDHIHFLKKTFLFLLGIISCFTLKYAMPQK